MSENQIDDYFLISDIEGAEAFFIHDPVSLVNCKHLIIELHDTKYEGKKIFKNDLKNKIIDLGFKTIESNDSVIYFKK